MSLAHVLGRIKRKGILVSAVFILITPIHDLLIELLDIIIFSHLALDDDLVVFYSEENIRDNAEYLYEYYRQNLGNKRIVWLRREKMDNYAKYVRPGSKLYRGLSARAYYFVSRAKIIYYTHIPAHPKHKKEGQIIINLWHGCGYKDKNKIDVTKANYWTFDYAIVPGNLFIESKSKFWNCSKEKILPIGYPRYDLIKKQEKLEKIIGFRAGKKIIIWTPTVRASKKMYLPENTTQKEFELPIVRNEKDLKILDSHCVENDVLLIIKKHPLQQEYSSSKNNYKNILFLNNEDINKKGIEFYQLLGSTNALITDYSSLAFDYLLVDKPLAFCVDDFEEYKKTRGFIFEDPYEYMPGAKIKNLDDLKKFISSIKNDRDDCSAERKKVKRLAHNPTGDYCRRTAEVIEKLAKGEK